jgi:diacylglycerol kinase family enzyme
VLIVNPNSGGGATGKNWESLYNQIKEIFRENPEVVFSQISGDITVTIDGESVGILLATFQVYQNALTVKF